MANDKCPGIDGLTVNKMFFIHVGDWLFEAVKESIKTSVLFESALTGVISLIPKANKDARYLKHLRPITLLNVDFKLYEKVLANRIKTVMENLIAEEQRGFMQNRRISVNIRKVLDIIKHASDEKIEAILISVDYQKAFDLVSHDAIIKTLQFFEFGEVSINMVKLAYTDFWAIIQNNGHFTEKIKIEQGVRQGTPNSSFLFILCAEVMAIMIREEKAIQGIPIKEMIHLFGQYADDMDTYMLAKEKSIQALFTVIECFCAQTGFKINYDKTTVYKIGSLQDSNTKLYTQKNLQWTKEPVNILGIVIDNSLQKTMDLNYNPLVKKAEDILRTWQKRRLSLIGKVMVINTLVASIFVHRMLVLPSIPVNMLRTLNSAFTNFLWNNGKPKIALKVLQDAKCNGGLSLVNLEKKDQALKCTWVKIIATEPTMANTAYNQLDYVFKENIWKATIKPEDVNLIFPKANPFWQDVLRAWAHLNFSENSDSVKTQIIWYNSLIRIDNKPIMWHQSFKKGLLYCHQLWEAGTSISIRKAMENFGLTIMQFNTLIAATPRP